MQLHFQRIKDLRATLGDLFNKKLGPRDPPTDDPGSIHSQPNKRKGKYLMKGPAKRKVKEHRLRVVGLVKFLKGHQLALDETP